jgi:hypothetical protein
VICAKQRSVHKWKRTGTPGGGKDRTWRRTRYNLEKNLDVDAMGAGWKENALRAANIFEGGSFAGVAKRSDYGAMGDYFHGARKAAERFSARERGGERAEELPVLPGKRNKDAIGNFGVWPQRERCEYLGVEYSGGAEQISGAGN